MATADDYDTVAALAEYHASRAGIRGLIDSGVTTVPPFFLAPASPYTPALDTSFAIPTVDLSLPRSAAVPLVGAAARTCGIFYVTNHGVQADALVSAVRAFHELPLAVRSELYTLTPVGGVTYCTVPYAFGPNPVGLLLWRDFLRVSLGSPAPDLGRIPAACRDALVESYRCLEAFAMEIAGMLSDALGVGTSRLQGAMHVEGSVMAGNYYPPCPEPARVEGSTVHTDPCVFTVLAQDDVGGLQVRLNGGDNDGQWVDVPPVPGALVVNVGDVLKVRMHIHDRSLFISYLEEIIHFPSVPPTYD
jgi:hypothetical protein